MEEIRDELYDCIGNYLISDIKTIEKSQELDKFIVDYMKEKLNSKKGETL